MTRLPAPAARAAVSPGAFLRGVGFRLAGIGVALATGLVFALALKL